MVDYVFKLPDVGEGIAEAEVVEWHVAAGDVVKEDQPLVDVMTDKATVEITSPVNGVIKSIHGTIGELSPVGSELVVFEVDTLPASHAAHTPHPAPEPVVEAAPEPRAFTAPTADTIEAFDDEEPVAAPPPAAPEPADVAPAAPPAAPSRGPVLASPAVRARALDLGIELSSVAGSGPDGRIEHRDLDALVRQGAGAPAAAPMAERHGETQVRVIGLRRRIAEKMQEAKRHIPHFTYVEAVDVTALEILRAHMNATRSADQPKLSLLPFLIRALVKVLPEFPQINATYDDEAGVVTRHAALHMGIATQTDNGLIVPVVRHAEARDMWDLSREIARLAAAARDGTAKREELSGSTLTLTSLGPLGGVTTTPVINRPEVGIIGPNNIVETPVVRDGHITVAKMMNISSSFDHRVVDGYDAALFIQRVKGVLEHPATIFI